MMHDTKRKKSIQGLKSFWKSQIYAEILSTKPEEALGLFCTNYLTPLDVSFFRYLSEELVYEQSLGLIWLN